MKFQFTQIAGVWLIEPEPLYDERGFFARVVSSRALAERGLPTVWPESSIAVNSLRHTLRGLHWQAPAPSCAGEPATGEHKLVRCTRGVVFDCAVDVRTDSPTCGHWQAFELSAQNWRTLYLPPGVAHGYLTLTDDCELFYQMAAEYKPALARGVRWNDPQLQIAWPAPPQVISPRDQNLPYLAEVLAEPRQEVAA